jgi:pimeloyl-ACP methyl ester carboxylesterase
MSAPREIRLDTPRLGLAALHWPNPGAPRVLALHGWLDNAASFIPLGTQLEALDFVALDWPGHGHSDHRHPTANYYFTEYLWELDAALDALAWDAAHLLGHSLGGAVASLYAAAVPERTLSLVTLDAPGPLAASAGETVPRLRRNIAGRRAAPRPLKPYASLEAMTAARLANSPDLDAAAARLICERAAQRVGDHLEWRTDPALYWTSPLLLTEEQVLDCLRHIEAPVLSITARPYGAWVNEETLRRRQAAIRHGVHESVEGNHHFHMDQPETMAGRVTRFIRAAAQGDSGQTEA